MPDHDNSLEDAIEAICALMVETNNGKPASRPIGFTADLTGKSAKRPNGKFVGTTDLAGQRSRVVLLSKE